MWILLNLLSLFNIWQEYILFGYISDKFADKWLVN